MFTVKCFSYFLHNISKPEVGQVNKNDQTPLFKFYELIGTRHDLR